MADAWGGSWGSSWADSWGVTVTAWGGSWGSSWADSWGVTVTPTPVSSGVGGGGWHGWRGPTPDERKRYLDSVKRLIAKKVRDDESFDRELEAAWNALHGITPMPDGAEALISAAVERVLSLPSRAFAERERMMGEMAAMLADIREEAIAEMEARAAAEEEDAIVALMASW